jgi:hypothetical protein
MNVTVPLTSISITPIGEASRARATVSHSRRELCEAGIQLGGRELGGLLDGGVPRSPVPVMTRQYPQRYSARTNPQKYGASAMLLIGSFKNP